MADLVKESRHDRMLGLYYAWHLGKTVDQMIANPIEVRLLSDQDLLG